MTQREPDWADEAARGIVERQYGDPEDFPEMRRDIAAALRAERERCAGIAEASAEAWAEGAREDDIDLAAKGRYAAKAGTLAVIVHRIRAGDQPGEPMREVTP